MNAINYTTLAAKLQVTHEFSSVIVAKGEAYPFKKTNRDFRTVAILHHGTDEELKIPILEGPEEKADCNKLVGTVTVPAKGLRMDLPVGSEVEVTFAAKEPGSIDVAVYIPLLDLEVENHLDINANAPEKDFLATEVAKERTRIGELSAKGISLGNAAELVSKAEKLVAGATDPESRQQAFTAIREARKALDEAEDAADWPNKEQDAEDRIEWLNEAVGKWGSQAQKGEAEDIVAEIRRAMQRKNAATLKRAVERADNLRFKIELARPEWWKGLLAYQYRQRDKMADRRKADLLFAQGSKAIAANDVEEMRRVAMQLWDLLPEDVAEEMQRGYGSGITQ